MSEESGKPEANDHADTFERHGKPDPSKWAERVSVTGRPTRPAGPNTTLAGRAKLRTAPEKVAAEDKPEPKKARAAKKLV